MQISKPNHRAFNVSNLDASPRGVSEGTQDVEAKEPQDPLQKLTQLLDELKAMLTELSKAKEEGEGAPAGGAPAGGSGDMMQKLLEMLLEILGLSEEVGKSPEHELAEILEQNPGFAQDLSGALQDMGASQGLMKSLGLGAGGAMRGAQRG